MNNSDSIKEMSVSELMGLLETCSYRPDFNLSVHDGHDHWWPTIGGACIALSMHVINSYHPDQPKMPLAMHQSIPPYVETVEDLYDWCLGICVWFEEHEAREWFKVNGKPWRNPHAEPAQQFNDRAVFNRVVGMRPVGSPAWSMAIQRYTSYSNTYSSNTNKIGE